MTLHFKKQFQWTWEQQLSRAEPFVEPPKYSTAASSERLGEAANTLYQDNSCSQTGLTFSHPCTIRMSGKARQLPRTLAELCVPDQRNGFSSHG